MEKEKIDVTVKIPRARKRLYEQANPASEKVNGNLSADDNTSASTAIIVKNENTSGEQEKDWKALEYDAKKVIRKYSFISAAPNLLPLPYVDLASQTIVLFKMTKEISLIYGHNPQDKFIRNLISAAAGGAACEIGGNRILFSVLKYVPIIGYGLGFASGVLLNGAVTYAFGKALIDHFETGNNLFNIDFTEFKKKFQAFLIDAKTDFIGA